MQHQTPFTHPVVRLGPWVRKRTNYKLRRLVEAPIADLYNTEFDAWHGNVYVSNPTWEAAVIESNRREDLYQRLVPLSKWGI